MQRLWIWHGPRDRADVVITVVGSVVRLAVAAFAVVFVWAGVDVGTQDHSGGVGALWFFLAGATAVAAWIVWDVVKSWGVVPAARLHIADDQIAFSTPLWGRTFTATTLRAGEPIAVSVVTHAVIPAGKTMYVYEFRQGDAVVRYLAPAAISERSAAALDDALAEAGSPLEWTSRSDEPRPRGRRAGRSLKP